MSSSKPPKPRKKTATTTSTTTDHAAAAWHPEREKLLAILRAVEGAGYQPIEICVGDVRVVMQPMPPAPSSATSDRPARAEPEDIYDEFGADDPEYQALKKRGSSTEG
jgi:hypothetical protein